MNQFSVAFRYLFLFSLALLGSATVLVFAYLLQQGPEQAQAVDLPAAAVAAVQPADKPSRISVFIYDNGDRQLLYTNAATVSGALQAAGVTLTPMDRVIPSADSPLSADMQIYVQRAIPLTVSVDGSLLQLRSAHRSAGDVLAEAEVLLGPEDYYHPGADAFLQAGDIIEVVRVHEELVDEDEPLPFDTEWQPSDRFELDTTGLVQPGVPGIFRRQWRVRYENGVAVARTLENEWVAQPSQPEIMGYGTRIVVRVVDTPGGAYEFWRVVRMRVTSYTASSSGKPPEHPAYGITASGFGAGTGIVAVDRNVVPFRSWVYVPGYGIGFAGDTGGGVIGRWIDLGFDEEEFVAWSGYVDVYYLTPIPELDKINFRIPTELP